VYVQQGHTYIGGASVPFFVSDSMIKSGAQGQGFDQVQVYSRKSFPIYQLPPIPPGSSNDWDTVVTGQRAAPDGNVNVPPGVRWVVDTTPVQVPVVMPPTPAPAPAPVPPFLQANPAWDWPVPAPLPPSKPSATGPAVFGGVPGDMRMPLIVGMGVVGGAFFAWQAYQHFFKEGLSEHERKNILWYTASVLAFWGASELIDVEEAWWLTPQGLATKAMEAAR
jgi:hypothetical protein